jgi:hypothetical protein
MEEFTTNRQKCPDKENNNKFNYNANKTKSIDLIGEQHDLCPKGMFENFNSPESHTHSFS